MVVNGPDGPLDPGGRKPRRVLSLLLFARGSVVTPDRLIDGLWGDEPPATARKTLQVHVSNLRRGLGSGFPLETTRAGYRIDPHGVVVDAAQFEAELLEGGALCETAPSEAGVILAGALRRWRGMGAGRTRSELAAERRTSRRVRVLGGNVSGTTEHRPTDLPGRLAPTRP
jgi:hypothetical protein